MTFINAFFSAAFRRAVNAQNLDTKSIAAKIGYKDDHLVRSCMNGGNMPTLKRLVAVANAVELPLEDLLLPWLCDSDPDNFKRYEIMCIQLMGPAATNDLLSGHDEVSKTPWWTIRREPMSAAQFAIQSDEVPPGTYSDAEGVGTSKP